jgi:2-amino-4-hydroxy-6-hydroxymethyldihydropteridine diphosphokinase
MHWHPAYVAIGSNLSDPARQVEIAIAALAGIEGARLVLGSSLWQSQPMGPRDQPDFVNAAAGLLTTLTPREFLGALQDLERRLGRTEPEVRWGPRVIDLDLLLYGDRRIDEPGLTLPHAGLHQRNFVLYPLAEIAPELWVPGHGRVQDLQRQAAGDGLERLAVRGSGD